MKQTFKQLGLNKPGVLSGGSDFKRLSTAENRNEPGLQDHVHFCPDQGICFSKNLSSFRMSDNHIPGSHFFKHADRHLSCKSSGFFMKAVLCTYLAVSYTHLRAHETPEHLV